MHIIKKLCSTLTRSLITSLALITLMAPYTLYANYSCNSTDGSLDITFNGTGKVTTNFGPQTTSMANGIVALSCGTIVTAGSTFIQPTFPPMPPFSTPNFALTGYTSYGVLNPDFGSDGTGLVITDFADVLGLPNSSTDYAHGAALQTGCPATCNTNCSPCENSCNQNCKIIVVGESNATPNNRTGFAVGRYTCEGILDTSFGTNGVTVIRVNDNLDSVGNAIAIQQDGKIVVCGYLINIIGYPQFAVIRLTCGGALDATFGCNKNGIVVTSFGPTYGADPRSLAIQGDGKIILAGVSSPPGVGPSDFTLVRYNTNGTLDKTFGTNGVVLTDFARVLDTGSESDDQINALVILEYNETCCESKAPLKIIAGGFTDVNSLNIARDFALVCYNEDGSLNTNFGPTQTGLVTTAFSSNISTSDTISALVAQKQCNQLYTITAAGYTNAINFNFNFALAQYLETGSLNTNFGTNGLAITSFTNNDQAFAITSQSNGNLIAAGSIYEQAQNGSIFALARYTICKQPCAPTCTI